MSDTQNAIVTIDGFADNDPTQSPLRGTAFRFKDGNYATYGDALDVAGRTFAIFDKREGWQKLEKDHQPEYLVRQPGEPRPPQPHVDKADWPKNLTGEPEHPWKLTTYLHMIDTVTGELLTFWSSTVGGRVATSELSDQISFMRRYRPRAIPVVELQSRDMPTSFGGSKPRPHFKIHGWKESDNPEQQLLTADPKLVDVKEPSLKEQMGNEEVPWSDPLPDLSKRDFGADIPKKQAKKK